jgi:hypothetical protein
MSSTNPIINPIFSVINELRSGHTLPFQDVLSVEILEKHLSKIVHRDRTFTPKLTLFVFLAQIIGADQSCQAAVCQLIAHLISKGARLVSPNTAAYCKARARLPETVLVGLTKEIAEQGEEQAKPEWLWWGRHVKLMDGSTLSMPDTPENQEAYPQSKAQKEGVGFPIMRVVCIISLATGAVLDLAAAPYSGKETGEHALLRKIIHTFQPGDVALGDCYYASFFLIATLMEMGVDAVFPIHSARITDFRRGKRLGGKDHLVNWKKPAKPKWMEQTVYEKFPDAIAVREVVVRSQRAGFRAKTRILVTTFCDPDEVNGENLASLYDCRWFVEISLKSIKDTMCMDILRAKTPQMVRKEIWAHLLAYNLIRKIIAESANRYDKNPRYLSFKCALQFIDAFCRSGCLLKTNEAYEYLLKAISQKTVGNRPRRSEPRMTKRRPKAFPRLQNPRSFYHQKAA